MAPHKAPKTLYELALSATRDLVLHSCKNIEDNLGLYDSPTSQAAVQQVQDYLRGYYVPHVWNSLLQVVTEVQPAQQTVVSDERILFSCFIFDGVKLTKLEIGTILHNVDEVDEEDEEEEYEAIGSNQQNVEFWIENAIKFKYLKEADLTNVQCDAVVIALCQNCSNLEILNLGYGLEEATLEIVLQSCPKLRRIVCPGITLSPRMTQLALELLGQLEDSGNSVLSNALIALDRNSCFMLQRHVTLRSVNLNQLVLVADIFPYLRELRIVSQGEDSIETFDYLLLALATNNLILYKISLQSFPIQMISLEEFLTHKGIHLTEIVLSRCVINSPLRIFGLIGGKCPNLTHLCIEQMQSDWAEIGEHYGWQSASNISLQKLKHLQIESAECNFELVCLVNECVLNAKNLTKVTWAMEGEDESEEEPPLEEWLVRLFTTNPRMKQLKELRLEVFGTEFTAAFAHLVYQKCPDLTRLNIQQLDDDADDYMQNLMEQVKITNLDLTIT